MGVLTTLLLMLSCALASHAAAISGFNFSSNHPALFHHEPCSATNTVVGIFGLLAVGSCFRRVANSGGTAITGGADEDEPVVMVMPPPDNEWEHHVSRYLLDSHSAIYPDRKTGALMMLLSVALYSYYSSWVLEMNQTLGRNGISSTTSGIRSILSFNSSECALREKKFSNCSSSSMVGFYMRSLFPPMLQVQPTAFVQIVYPHAIRQPAHSSYRSTTSKDRGYRLQNSRILMCPSTSRHERRRKLLQVAATQKQSTTKKARVLLVRAPSSVAVSAVLVLTCTVAVAGLLVCCKRRTTRRSTVTVIKPETLTGSGPRRFSYSELAAATDNFAEERKIGRGGFGAVYRGYLGLGVGHDVAIKVLSREQSAQGVREFHAEVVVMSQLRHRNIVRLIGWCDDSRKGLLLVYELVPGGSLHMHLYGPGNPLTWAQRHKIALGLGSALLYLHTDCDRRVVHGDIKPANVMLDASRDTAKLGDFGLARLVDHGAEEPPHTTQLVAGTVGYIDPELINTRRPGTECDVYSFGVVLLEIACGRRPTVTATTSRQPGQATALPLLASVRDMYDRGMILDTADPRLDGEFDKLEMERLLVTGLWCTHRDTVQRPSISQAMDVLRSPDARLPVLQPMRCSRQVRYWEAQAYGGGDSSDEISSDDGSLLYASSTATAYLTPEDSTHLLAGERQIDCIR